MENFQNEERSEYLKVIVEGLMMQEDVAHMTTDLEIMEFLSKILGISIGALKKEVDEGDLELKIQKYDSLDRPGTIDELNQILDLQEKIEEYDYENESIQKQ